MNNDLEYIRDITFSELGKLKCLSGCKLKTIYNLILDDIIEAACNCDLIYIYSEQLLKLSNKDIEHLETMFRLKGFNVDTTNKIISWDV